MPISDRHVCARESASAYMARLREGTDPRRNACPVYVAVMYEPPGATCPGDRLAAAAYKYGLL